MKKKLWAAALVSLAVLMGALALEAGPTVLTTSIKHIFTNGATFSGGTVSFSGATVTGLASGGALTLENGETITNATNSVVTVTSNTAGGPTIMGADDSGASSLTIDTTGAGTIVFGSADVTQMVHTTDGGSLVFDGDILFPNSEKISNSADGMIRFERNNAGTVTLSAADDDATAALSVIPGGAAGLTLGGANTTALTVTTNAGGNSAVVLPNGVVGGAEMAAASLRVAYCGENAENGITYFGANGITVLEDALGSAGCDALDNGTEATADVVLSAGLTMHPKYMRCITDGTLGSGETIVAQLRDDTADVTGVTCTIAEAQTTCEVLVPTAAAVAAGSATAVKVTQTSNNADDNAKCVLLYSVN